jgi:LysM repeat protein
MNKRPGAMKGFTLKDNALLSKSEKNTLGRTSKANAAKEKFIQKNRNFAKGTGKLAVKNRVGTKAEYKQLGKDIEMRKQLIASSKTARAAQAARAANPAPAKATTLTKAVTPMAAKKKTPSPKTKPSTAAIKKRTVPNTNPKSKAMGPKLQTLNEAKSKAPKPKSMTNRLAIVEKDLKSEFRREKAKNTSTGPKLQTLDQAKASAPKPRGPMLGPEKPSTTLSKPAGKIASKVAEAKSSAGSKALSVGSKLAKNKYVKVGGKLVKLAVAVNIAKEIAQNASGQSTTDVRRIQALENRIAVAKGQKPKYTKSTSNKPIETLKTEAGNALSLVGLGKSRKARLAELKTMATKVGARTPGPKGGATSKPPQGKKPVLTKGSNAPATTSGNKYRVNAGDTLSGIASRAGVSLKDLRASNPQITDPRKIYRNTGVVIPKGGKVPTGGYTKKAK